MKEFSEAENNAIHAFGLASDKDLYGLDYDKAVKFAEKYLAEIGDLNGLFAINVGNLGLADDELDDFMEE